MWPDKEAARLGPSAEAPKEPLSLPVDTRKQGAAAPVEWRPPEPSLRAQETCPEDTLWINYIRVSAFETACRMIANIRP